MKGTTFIIGMLALQSSGVLSRGSECFAAYVLDGTLNIYFIMLSRFIFSFLLIFNMNWFFKDLSHRYTWLGIAWKVGSSSFTTLVLPTFPFPFLFGVAEAD